MWKSITAIIEEIKPVAVISFLKHGAKALNNFIGNKEKAERPADANAHLVSCVQKVGKEVGLEAAKIACHQAAALVPGGNLVQGLAKTAAAVAVKGVDAAFEGEDVTREILTHGLRAFNQVLLPPPVAFPASLATDCIANAFANYKNGLEQQAYQAKGLTSGLQSERIVENLAKMGEEDLTASFMLVKAAPAA